MLLLLVWVHAPVLGNATTDAMPASEFTLGPATAPLYAYAPTIVRSASFDVVEPAVGRKPRAIIQTASSADGRRSLYVSFEQGMSLDG